MKFQTALAAATAALALGGVVAYAQTRQPAPQVHAAAQPQAPAREDRNALERLRDWVMDQGGTERAFQNAYWDHHEPGIYVEARTGEPLFASTDKFDSGSGWPSFTRPIDTSAVTRHRDRSIGVTRTEVRSSQGGAHLGHVFNDGPRNRGGQRFCINSCAMRFIPRAEMEAQGYGEYTHLIDNPQPD